MSRNPFARCNGRHLRSQTFGTIYSRRCCLSQLANELRGTVMPRLRRVNRLCSRTVSDTVNMWIHERAKRVLRKKKSSAVPLFRSGRMSAICARLSKGKGRFTRGRKPQVSVLLCARAASAQFPFASQAAKQAIKTGFMSCVQGCIVLK